MTDNDMMFTMRYAFYSNRLTRFEQALKSAGIEHGLIRPRSPESNGKVERFIKTIDDECYRITQPHVVAGQGRRAEAVSSTTITRGLIKAWADEPRHVGGTPTSPKAGRNLCPGTSQLVTSDSRLLLTGVLL